jgi:hypothetical protein
MSTQQDISLWEFLDSGNFESTQNLKLLSSVLLTDKDALMNAYGWEYEEWLDETNEEQDDGEDAYFNACKNEEREYDEYTTKI